MQFSIKTSALEKTRTACAIVAVTGGELSASARALDAASGNALSEALATGDLANKAGATLLIGEAAAAQRVLLVSMGEEREVGEKAFVDALRSAFRFLQTTAAGDAVSCLHEAAVGQRSTAWKMRQQVLVAREIGYRFEQLKTKREPAPRGPKSIVLLADRAESASLATEVARAEAIANGMQLAKDLGNLPPNVCTPSYLAETARKIARDFKLKVDVLDQKQMESLKMGALLAVARGSTQPPKLIVLHYSGAPARQAPVALIGKGITFDSGGISLKPGADMDEMKFDMSGAGSVLGTIRAIAEMKLKINVVGIVPACENMPSGHATRPGDILTTMSGQTVEVLNTDAEGRLILCDALTFAARFKPAVAIDIATLTGACVIALGHANSGLFTRQDALAAELLAAGKEVGDPCWRMPLDDEYQEQLKSPFADMANIGGRAAGAVTAACFLSRYAKDFDWAHLDVAGTAWKSGQNKGSTGRPVPLLSRFLISRAPG
ncbi:MAG TPA: leucyl aminopeptidase [Burkholderiaceae bacterium]|nr:leucyl aminopeptidase [Burkholderiaceae bacterium]